MIEYEWGAFWKHENFQEAAAEIDNVNSHSELVGIISSLLDLKDRAEAQMDHYDPRHNQSLRNLKRLVNVATARFRVLR